MEFGNPQFLWALPAAALPVLLHLFFRRRRRQVDFSTLQFFRVRERFLAHRRRLEELLLLLLRTLAILLLVLALSRPRHQNIPFVGGARTDAVIIVDDSLSMGARLAGGEPAFELARRKAAEILATLEEGDGGALVWLSGRAGLPLTRRRQDLQRHLESMVPTAAAGSFAAAWREAEAQLNAAGSPNRELYLISGFQRQQLPTAPLATRLDKRVRLYCMAIAGSRENLTLHEVEIDGKPKVVGQPMRIAWAATNTGTSQRGTTLALQVGGRELRSEYHTLAAGQTVHGAFDYVPTAAGLLEGSVRLDDEFLSLDNEQVFVADVGEPIRVLLLETDVLSRADPHHFFERALCPPGRETVNGFVVERLYLQELQPQSLATCHVVVLADPPTLPAATAKLLHRFVEGGGGIILLAGSQSDGETFSQAPELGLGPVFAAKQTVEQRGLAFAGPLAGLNELLRLDLLEWRRRHSLPLDATWSMLAEVAGQPVLASRKSGAGTWIVAGFSARRDYSNWPELKSFPVAMIHLVDLAARDARRPLAVECGQPAVLTPLHADRPLRLQVDQAVVELAADGAEQVAFRETWRPGLVRVDGGTPASLILVPSRAAGVLDPVAGTEAAAKIVARPANQLDMVATIDSQIRQFRQGSDLAGLCLALLALVLGGEYLLGNRRRSAGGGRKTG